MRILIADDDPTTRRLLELVLIRWGYDVTVTEDGQHAAQALRRPNSPRLVILNWMMPGLDGVDICREIRARQDHRYTYIVLLTARYHPDDVVAGIEAGADDYLTKPFDLHELQARLRAAQRILAAHEQLLAACDSLQHQATHDQLTGVWNRAALFDLLERTLQRGRRTRSSTSVLLADLDHFKRVNDLHGHPAGDSVLVEVAHRIRSTLRVYDSVGRFGGEEFLVLVPDCDTETARQLAERMIERVGSEPIQSTVGPTAVTLSIGIGTCESRVEMDADSLVRAADAALYSAKQNGRNRVEVSDVGGTPVAIKKPQWSRTSLRHQTVSGGVLVH